MNEKTSLKTSNFFVIDNYNTVPIELLDYCIEYKLYDCSTELDVKNELVKNGIKFESIPRTGHNITTYFRYFIDYYSNLPETICLLKGHMIGRHLSKDFFERSINNKYFTFLYEDKNYSEKPNISMRISENQFLEINNSWYVNSKFHEHRYFDNFDRLLKFIFKNPIIPKYNLFAPGACYIVNKSQVLKYSKIFYANLNFLMSYSLNPNFPSEAHQIERMLPIIFNSNYEVNEWMNDQQQFREKIEEERIITSRKKINKSKLSIVWRLINAGIK